MIIAKHSPQTDNAKHQLFIGAEWINFIITTTVLITAIKGFTVEA